MELFLEHLFKAETERARIKCAKQKQKFSLSLLRIFFLLFTSMRIKVKKCCVVKKLGGEEEEENFNEWF